VRWYLTYRLSYRDLVEMMAERGVTVSHSTILRWVQRYVPEFEKRWGRYARHVHSSWRMDETAVSIRGGAHYLYRAVDKYGKTVDSLLSADRSESAARAFFCKALKTHQPRRPHKLNLDGNAATHRALRMLMQENPEWRSVEIRSRRYLNNIVEQDHRAIKRRCAPMLALKSFRTAAITLAGVELAHRIRKRQFSFGRGCPRRFSSLKHLWTRALLVTPKGALHWRFAYRFARKYKKLCLGTYPVVTLEWARSRHEFARNLLANGVDPAALKAEIGRHAFGAMMREWEIVRGHKSHLEAVKDVLRGLPQ
jgi:transposase-like protein